MHFFILGGTGFVGSHLAAFLDQRGHRLSLLVRRQPSRAKLPKSCRLVSGDPLAQQEDWQDEAAQADVLVNLVGKNIMTRWTEQEKEAIVKTRVQSTDMAVQALARAPGPPPCLINANAVGYYPSDGRVHGEDGPAGDSFLARVCVDWQEAALKAEGVGARTVILRIAPVLGRGGGMLSSLLPVFKLGLGGRVGSGRQGFPWIHIQDLARSIELMAETPSIHGPVNACAPEVLNNAAFTKALAKAVRRPALLPVPKTALKLVFGEMAQMLLESPKAKPEALEQAGFAFRYPRLKQALEDVLQDEA